MGKFKEKLYRFMYGRYGTDNLYNFLSYFSLILILVDLVAMVVIRNALALSIVSTVIGALIMFILIWSLYRTFSKNIAKRRRENEIYIKVSRAVKRFFNRNTSKGTKTVNRDDANYVFRDCTKCSSTLRLPRRAGRNRVKCPRCSHSFYVKAKKYKYKKQK